MSNVRSGGEVLAYIRILHGAKSLSLDSIKKGMETIEYLRASFGGGMDQAFITLAKSASRSPIPAMKVSIGKIVRPATICKILACLGQDPKLFCLSLWQVAYFVRKYPAWLHVDGYPTLIPFMVKFREGKKKACEESFVARVDLDSYDRPSVNLRYLSDNFFTVKDYRRIVVPQLALKQH